MSWSSRRAAALFGLPLLALLACTIQPPEDTIAQPLRNFCQQNEDCPSRLCDEGAGMCVANQSQFKAVLIEVVSAASDSRFGGREFFQRLVLEDGVSELELLLDQPSDFSGRVALWLVGCKGRSIDVTLRSRNEALGLSAIRYSVRSDSDFVQLPNTITDYSGAVNAFKLTAIPAGAYDLYWKDRDNPAPTPGCPIPAVPQLTRGVQLPSPPLNFSQADAPPREIKVYLPWRPELAGWTVDVVHNITGERLSSQQVLGAELVVQYEEREQALAVLRVTDVVNPDYKSPIPASALVRLRPPEGQALPTISLGLSAVSLDDPNVAEFPSVGPFSELVHYRAWVWQDGNPNLPVRGHVRFSATQLNDVVGASVGFTRTAEIDERGGVELELPAGNYVVDVTPERLSEVGRFRTSAAVWGAPPSADAGAVQAGQLFAIAEMPRLKGRVRAPDGSRPVGVRVNVQPSARGGFSTTVELPRFTPRVTTAVAQNNGTFELPIDCSSCSEETPTLFDVVLQPPVGSGLAWVVFHDVPISGDTDLGDIEITAPRRYGGRLAFPDPAGLEPKVFPGPLVRAFALLDRSGAIVGDHATPTCVDLEAPRPDEPIQPCVQKAVQVAEARVGIDGHFDLLLPQRFAEPPAVPAEE